MTKKQKDKAFIAKLATIQFPGGGKHTNCSHGSGCIICGSKDHQVKPIGLLVKRTETEPPKPSTNEEASFSE